MTMSTECCPIRVVSGMTQKKDPSRETKTGHFTETGDGAQAQGTCAAAPEAFQEPPVTSWHATISNQVAHARYRTPCRRSGSRSHLLGWSAPLRPHHAIAFYDRPWGGNRQPLAALRPSHLPQLRRRGDRSQSLLHRGSRPAPRSVRHRGKLRKPPPAGRRRDLLHPRALLRDHLPLRQH